MHLTRSNLICALCSELDLSRGEAKEFLLRFTAAIVNALSSGDEVQLRGFGSFKVADNKRGRCTRFKSSKRLKGLVRDAPEPDPVVALLVRQLDSAQEIETVLAQHARWREDRVGDRAELGRLDLEGADLFGASLQSAKLTGAMLSRADLGDADLQEADLERADLTGASLAWANLKGANLKGACLKRADLRWADLRRAELSDAVMEGADLREALLDGTAVEPRPPAVGRREGWMKRPLPDPHKLKRFFSFVADIMTGC
jgi:nucleoid DNA-binding protein